MTQVLINDVLPRTQSIAGSGQTLYSTTWTANVASDVIVYSRPAGTAADDATQIVAYPAGYSVAFIGSQNIVQVTLITPSTIGDIVTIIRNTPADRENLYTNTNFTPSMLNNDFGILTLVDQQAQLVNQLIAPRYNYSALIDLNPSFPTADTILPILGPGQVWMKDTGNDAIVAVDFATGSGGNISSWITVSTASYQASGGEGIVADRASTPVQVELPATFNVGDEIGVLGLGAGGWSVVCNSGQTIKFGSLSTSVAGSISSDIQYANIFLRGLVANTTWTLELTNSNPTII